MVDFLNRKYETGCQCQRSGSKCYVITLYKSTFTLHYFTSSVTEIGSFLVRTMLHQFLASVASFFARTTTHRGTNSRKQYPHCSPLSYRVHNMPTDLIRYAYVDKPDNVCSEVCRRRATTVENWRCRSAWCPWSSWSSNIRSTWSRSSGSRGVSGRTSESLTADRQHTTMIRCPPWRRWRDLSSCWSCIVQLLRLLVMMMSTPRWRIQTRWEGMMWPASGLYLISLHRRTVYCSGDCSLDRCDVVLKWRQRCLVSVVSVAPPAWWTIVWPWACHRTVVIVVYQFAWQQE